MDRYEISQTYDGKWRTPTRLHFYRACCDCGLVHREQHRLNEGKIQYRVWRDKEETEKERKRINLYERLQAAIFAALGCTKIDYRSPKKIDAAAGQIAHFVEAALTSTVRGSDV